MTPAQAFLNRIEIASPCPANWAEMSGDDRVRFCAQCDKHVYDLSTLRAEEAVALIREKEGALCVRLWRRADGTVMTADCPVGARWAVSRRRTNLSASSAALLSLALLAVGCADPVISKERVEVVATRGVAASSMYQPQGQVITVEVLASLPQSNSVTVGMLCPPLSTAVAPQVAPPLEPPLAPFRGTRRGPRVR